MGEPARTLLIGWGGRGGPPLATGLRIRILGALGAPCESIDLCEFVDLCTPCRYVLFLSSRPLPSRAILLPCALPRKTAVLIGWRGRRGPSPATGLSFRVLGALGARQIHRPVQYFV